MARILITGANSGFGLDATRRLAARGDTVYATVRDLARASGLDELVDEGLPVMITSLDVRDAERAHAVVHEMVTTGGIDALVNNAGVSMFAAMEQVSIDQARDMMEINYFGPLRLMRLVLPHMRAQRSGRVVNVSSGAGYMPVPYLSTYTATKHALDGMSMSLDLELSPWGIRICLISPGGYDTAVGENLWRPEGDCHELHYVETAATRLDQWRSHVRGRDPSEVGAAIVDAVHGDEPSVRTFVGEDVQAGVAHRRMFVDDDAWMESMRAGPADPGS